MEGPWEQVCLLAPRTSRCSSSSASAGGPRALSNPGFVLDRVLECAVSVSRVWGCLHWARHHRLGPRSTGWAGSV
jgi:hypothetical protein